MIVRQAPPLLLIHLYSETFTSILEGLPFLPTDINKALGFTIPIPLFIDATDQSKIVIRGIDNTIDITTTFEQSKDSQGKNITTFKQGLASTDFSISGQYRADSIIAGVLITALKTLVNRLVGLNYAISFFYESNVILFGRLKSFTTDAEYNTNMVNFKLTLSTAVESEQGGDTVSKASEAPAALPPVPPG